MTEGQLLILLKLMDLLVVGLEHAPTVKATYLRHKAALDSMVQEGRNPTPDEIRELGEEISETRERLRRRMIDPDFTG